MFAIKITAAVAGLVWAVVLLLRCSLLVGCFALLLATVCFGRNTLGFNVGPIPMSIDRLLVFGLIALYVVQRCLGRTQPKPLRICDYILFAFAAVITVSALTHDFKLPTEQSTTPIYRLLFGYWIPILVYWVARQSDLNEHNLTRFYCMMVGLGTYLAVTGLLEITGQWSFVLPRYIADPTLGIHFGRARGPMLNSVYFGMYVSICTFVLATLMRKLRPPAIGMAVLLACIFLTAIYFTYTRSIWLGVVIGIGVLGYFAFDLSMRPLMLVATLLIAVILSVLNSNYLIAMERDMSSEETRKSSMSRVITAYVSWQMFKERPLLGCGFGQYPVEKNRFLSDRDTNLRLEQIRNFVNHNSFLSLLTETGAIGLALFVSLLISWAKVAIQILQRGTAPAWACAHAVLFLCCLGVYVVQFALHPLSYSPLPNLIVFLMAGIAMGLQHVTEVNRNMTISTNTTVRTHAGAPTAEHRDLELLAT
jgi:O-antigen ligase